MKIVTNLLPSRLLQKIKETCFLFLKPKTTVMSKVFIKSFSGIEFFSHMSLSLFLDFKMIQMGFKIFTALETGLGNSEIFIPRTKA